MGNLCTGSQNTMTREALAQSYSKGDDAKSSKLLNANHLNDANLIHQADQGHSKTTRINSSHARANNPKRQDLQRNQLVQRDVPGRVYTRYTYGNGDHYDGHVLIERRDIRDGQGIFYCSNKQKRSNYEYHGEWRHNVREGHGHCYYYNDELYVGQWKADKRHGHGELFSRKQDRYKGQWKNDMRDGKGTFTAHSGASFAGKWAQDKKHGLGEMTGTDKLVFIEIWKYGVLISRKLKSQSGTHESSASHKAFLDINAKDQSKIEDADCNGASLNETQKSDLQVENKVALMLAANPYIQTWTQGDVLTWIQKSTLLAKMDDNIASVFETNQVDGKALLRLTEDVLKGDYYNIDSLGRRKNIIRAINFLKAKSCRQVQNESRMVMAESSEFQINRSHGSLQRHNRSGMSLPAIDRKAILKSAQSFFLQKVATRNSNKLQFTNDQSLSTDQHSQPQQQSSTGISGLLTQRFSESKHFGMDALQTRTSITLQSQNGVDLRPNSLADPESSMALGQDAGLIEALGQNGFNFFIEFKELIIDPRNDLIGRGGYGDVFKARWFGTKVAVKKFGRRYVTRKALKDFIKEIEMLNQLRHPNIVLYMGVSVDEQTQSYFYMVTEFVSKGSLFDLLHQRQVVLDDSQIIKIAKQMAIALLYLHNRQLYHCDLKSQNVLITEDWSVKLCDFGLSRYQSKFDADNHGKIGTPHWMAPEILRGEKYTSAADVYSFGAILWEMLASDIPFKGRQIPQITGMVGYYRETLKVPPQCNASLRKIVNNCLVYDPERRPNFEHIVEYLKQVEVEAKKDESVSPIMITKLRDFLY